MAGDRDAFAELVEIHQHEVYTLALRLTRDPHLAGDVAQEAFIRAWRALPKFRGDAQFGTWLWIVGSARYTLQLADELVMRVRDPDHPFAYAAQERTVNRDLGDVFELRLSPRFRMNETISLGIEYKWRSKGSDEYSGDGVPDPSPLASESSQSRHRLGVGARRAQGPRLDRRRDLRAPDAGALSRRAGEPLSLARG